MKPFPEIGVQSYCYREFHDLHDLAAAVKETGLRKIELCASHIDFADRSRHLPVIEALTADGIKISSTGVNRIPADEEKARPFFDFLRAAGVKQMSVFFPIDQFPDCLRTAEKLAEEYDVRLAIHNHGGACWLGSVEALRHVIRHGSPRIGLMLDTAWAMHTGTPVRRYIDEFRDRLFGVHFKDFSFSRSGQWKDEPLGEGNLDLVDLKAALDDVGFDGEPFLEFEGDASDPVPALKKCVETLRGVFS